MSPRTLDRMMAESFTEEYAKHIISNSHISAIHEDAITYPEIQEYIEKYKLEYFRMSDGFYYLSNDCLDRVNHLRIVEDRDELYFDWCDDKAEAVSEISSEILKDV